MSDIPKDIFISHPQGNRKGDGRIAIITADGTEDQEFFYPYYRFLEEGYQVDVLTPDGGEFKGKHGAGLKSTMKIADADPASYELLYIPGGKAPPKLKKEEEALTFVRDFCATGKPIAAICHGPQLLAEADVIDGCDIAAWPECQEEVEAAGASFVNEECVRDGQFVTARWPGDLPGHVHAVLDSLKSKGDNARRVA